MKTIGISIKRSLFMSCAVVASAMSAMAAPIFVNNFSFETLPGSGLTYPCGTGCSFSGATPIPFWTSADGSGQFQPGADAGNFTSFNSVDDGPTSAYTNGPTISQTVVPTVQFGVLYTLLVDIGSRKDTGAGGSAALVINGNAYVGTGSLVPGGWGTFTATYLGTLADVGSAITIALRTSGIQGNFDNVRLSDDTSSAVPEPATLGLIGFGLLAAATFRRRANSARQ